MQGIIPSEEEALALGMTVVELWLKKIEAARKEEEDWRAQAKKSIDVYENAKDSKIAFNIHNANINVVRPALYNSTPISDVRRKHQPDGVDPDAIAEQVQQQQGEEIQQAAMAEAQRQAGEAMMQAPQIDPNTGEQVPIQAPDPQQLAQQIGQQMMQQAIQQAVAEAQKAEMDRVKRDKTVSHHLERSAHTCIEASEYDDVLRGAVDTALQTGRGVVLVKYVPQVGTIPDRDGTEYEDVVHEDVAFEEIPWDKYIRGPGRTWEVMPWFAIEREYTKQEVWNMLRPQPPELPPEPEHPEPPEFVGHDETDDALMQAHEAKISGIQQQHAHNVEILTNTYEDEVREAKQRLDRLFPGKKKGAEDEQKHKGIVQSLTGYQVFDRIRKQVFIVCETDIDEPLHVAGDELGLQKFFPIAKPLQFNRRTGSQTPICDYDIIQPLIEELDEVTKRIAALVRELRVRGLYDPKMTPAFEQLETLLDGQYATGVAGEQWVDGKGATSMEDLIHHWPMDPYIKALQQLYAQRDQLINTIYQMTGITDIQRGASNPNETLGAQKLKANFGSQRIQEAQKEVARFCRDLLRIAIEIVAKRFRRETIEQMSGIPLTPEVEQIIRDDVQRTYAIDIETDSTIRADIQRDMDMVNNFIGMTGQFGGAVAAIAPVMPQTMPMMFEVFVTAARRILKGKAIEDAFDKMIEAAKQGVQQQDSGPSQEQMQHEQQMQQGEHEGNLALEREKQNTEKTKAQTEQVKAQSAQIKGQAEMAKAQAESQRHTEDMNSEVQVAEQIASLPDDQMMRLLAALQALKGGSNGGKPRPNGSIGPVGGPNGRPNGPNNQGMMQ